MYKHISSSNRTFLPAKGSLVPLSKACFCVPAADAAQGIIADSTLQQLLAARRVFPTLDGRWACPEVSEQEQL